MKASRIFLSLALGLAMTSCAPVSKVVTLRSDARFLGGREVEAHVEAPGDWYQATKRSDRADLAAPDNFSSMSLSLAPVLGDPASCPDLVRRAASEAAIAVSKKVKPEFVTSPGDPNVVDFQLTVPGSPPGPSDRFVQGRVMCRNGAMAVITCTTGVHRRG
ncbi:MAG: hypothetical protein HY901_32195, partial [Deltaproteobacteria bacterium]|nr:hypothetical protein [Deltaproteobacteria bacterium]